MQSLTHFEQLETCFFANPQNFDMTTLKQLQHASFAVQNKEKNAALAEMFSIELKFTIDCIKKSFNGKHKILEIDEEVKFEFKKSNPITNETTCCLCDYPLESRAENVWANNIFKAEHLFLSNIYSRIEMKKMGIYNFEEFSAKLNKIFDKTDLFCKDFQRESLDYPSDREEAINEIKKIKTIKEDENQVTKEKIIGYLYKTAIKFLLTEKIQCDFPMSETFLSNMISILKNQRVVHHSHVTGKIIGYTHEFCYLKCKENYFTIPVLAHNQFRFDFSLFKRFYTVCLGNYRYCNRRKKSN